MTDNIPFSIDTLSWDELSESQRDFFCFEEEYIPLPADHARQIHRLDSSSAKRVVQWLAPSFPDGWPDSTPHFATEIVLRLDGKNWNTEEGVQSVRQWLHDRGVSYAADVFLIYDVTRVIRMPWKLVLKYWDALAWSVGYAMFAIDHTRQWACCFHHEDVIVFGTFDNQNDRH